MARGGGRPFARRGRGQSRGRGRGGGRGSIRGGGRGGRGASFPQSRHGFRTSRIEEVEDVSGDDQIPEEQDVSEEEVVSEQQSASDDDEEEDSAPRRSYATLLQALKSDRKQEEPARKKRRVENGNINGHGGQAGETDAESMNDLVNTEDDGNKHDPLAEDLAEDVEEDIEEDVETANLEDSEDEDVLSRDPFELHFAGVEETPLKIAISARKDKTIENSLVGERLKKQSISYDDQVQGGMRSKKAKDFHLKQRLQKAGATIVRSLSKAEHDLALEVASYRDIQYGDRRPESASTLREIVCLHALNHVFKTRDRVLKNNAKLSQNEGSENLDLRDQGFTRPKVLVIVPTKQACFRYIESVIKVSEPDQQENKSRLSDTFSQEDDDTWESKPPDFRELFGGNHEEDFRVGLKFTRKTIKYFSGFYNSDIIFGSALGLMRTITTGGGAKDKKKGHDADFLSSIEVLVVDHAAAIQMQNFQHLEYVFTQLNQLPKDSHGCDFARVRHWYLDGNAKHLRQTILFTSHHTPELNSLFSNHTFNIAGSVKYIPTYTGSMLSLPPSVSAYSIPQTFLRFDSPTPQSDSDMRFKFFTTAVLPSLLRHNTKGTLIFIPTYFDFVRLRNHLSTSRETISLSFGSLSEYTPVRDTARTRSHFMNSRHSVLIYSERAHHHFRYRIRGVKRVVFYGVPENPIFWGEIVGALGLNQDLAELDESRRKGGKGMVRALFSRWDVLKLERIVGTERVGRLVNDRGGDTFEFV